MEPSSGRGGVAPTPKSKPRSRRVAVGKGYSLRHIEPIEWSAAQWAKRHNLGPSFVYELLKDGKLGFYELNGRKRITIDHERDFMAARTETVQAKLRRADAAVCEARAALARQEETR